MASVWDLLSRMRRPGDNSEYMTEGERRRGRLDDPLERLRRSALQPGNVLAQGALSRYNTGEQPFDPGMARGSRNYWDALVSDIMYGTSRAVPRVPTVSVDSGHGIAVEDPRMFSDELRDTIIQNRAEAGLDERGRPVYDRYVGPTADAPGDQGYGKRADSTGYWADMGRQQGFDKDPEFMDEIGRVAGLKLTPEQRKAGVTLGSLVTDQIYQRYAPGFVYSALKARGWRSPR
jgi:hypothetical protein